MGSFYFGQFCFSFFFLDSFYLVSFLSRSMFSPWNKKIKTTENYKMIENIKSQYWAWCPQNKEVMAFLLPLFPGKFSCVYSNCVNSYLRNTAHRWVGKEPGLFWQGAGAALKAIWSLSQTQINEKPITNGKSSENLLAICHSPNTAKDSNGINNGSKRLKNKNI